MFCELSVVPPHLQVHSFSRQHDILIQWVRCTEFVQAVRFPFADAQTGTYVTLNTNFETGAASLCVVSVRLKIEDSDDSEMSDLGERELCSTNLNTFCDVCQHRNLTSFSNGRNNLGGDSFKQEDTEWLTSVQQRLVDCAVHQHDRYLQLMVTGCATAVDGTGTKPVQAGEVRYLCQVSDCVLKPGLVDTR